MARLAGARLRFAHAMMTPTSISRMWLAMSLATLGNAHAAEQDPVPVPAGPPSAVQNPVPAPKPPPANGDAANGHANGAVTPDGAAAVPAGDPLAKVSEVGGAEYCRLVTRLRPEKLMPGQSGTIDIIMIFVGDVLLPSPAPVTIQTEPQQGVVAVGSGTFRPAKPGGATAKTFAGRPVYDNTAICEVPVTVSADAVVGSLGQVTLALTMDLYSGATGQPLGRFLQRAACVVPIGQTTAVQPTPGTTPEGANEPPRSGTPVDAPGLPRRNPIDSAGNPLAAEPALPLPDAGDVRSTTPAAPVVPGSGGSFVLILGGAGAVILVVPLLLAQRSRR